MRRILLGPFALLLGLIPFAARADAPAAGLLQKCAATVQAAQSFSVAVSLHDDVSQDDESAYLAFSLPNRLKIVSRLQDTVTATVVCYGHCRL